MSDERLEVGNRVRLLASVGDLLEGQKGTVLAHYENGDVEMRADGTLDDFVVPADKVERIIPLASTEPAAIDDAVDVGQGVTAAQARQMGWTEDEIRTAAETAATQRQQEEVSIKANLPFLAALLAQGSTGDMERTRAQYGIRYVRSGTPEELLEVQCHLQTMIDQGVSYRFMERFLMTLGYLPVTIRRAFKNLTGMRCEDVVNYENYFMSPGSIPTFNHGWGKAKGGKGYYFIMPMTTYYGVFCQKDDRTREEVSRHPELMDAIEACRKLVSRLERWDPPVKDVKRTDMVPSEMYRQPQLYMNASENGRQVADILRLLPSKALRVNMIRSAFRTGQISESDRKTLMAVFADAEKEVQQEAVIDRTQEVEQDLKKRPVSEEVAEKTPNDFFQQETLKTRYQTMPANVIDMVARYVQQLNGDLRDFLVVMGPFKYIPIQRDGAPPPSQSDEPDLLNAVVTVGVLLDIYDKSGPAETNHKRGMLVFSVIGNQLWTDDTIKGEDGNEYALSDDGLGKYFMKERTVPQGR